jgi:hypothetical protein
MQESYFFLRNSCVAFQFLFDLVKDLLFTILIKSDMVRSMSRLIQAMLERRSHITSWKFEFSSQCIDQQWNIVLQFCDITNVSNMPASEFDG